VTEIAMAAGFNSRNVFSRLYKERYGETPYGHRGSNKGGNESYSGMSNPDCSYHT
jgi:AraC-like DNA-binding protein